MSFIKRKVILPSIRMNKDSTDVVINTKPLASDSPVKHDKVNFKSLIKGGVVNGTKGYLDTPEKVKEHKEFCEKWERDT